MNKANKEEEDGRQSAVAVGRRPAVAVGRSVGRTGQYKDPSLDCLPGGASSSSSRAEMAPSFLKGGGGSSPSPHLEKQQRETRTLTIKENLTLKSDFKNTEFRNLFFGKN